MLKTIEQMLVASHASSLAGDDPTHNTSQRMFSRPYGESDHRSTQSPRADIEFQSLFDNAICGIYLDFLDGKPIRANRALCTFNGYDSEADHLAAVKKHGGSWYVDPDRAKYFQHQLELQGYVRDMVSEVYRHRTREKAWIAENAWYVRDKDGTPLYIEGTIQDATERVQATAEIERQANTDALTGAASRFGFMKALHDAVSPDQGLVALLTVDLDKFKAVNDIFGHSSGDMVLKVAVKRLRKSTNGFKATIGRLGGDEFAILVQQFQGEAEIRAIAAAIVRSLAAPIAIEGQDIVVGASVGAAISPTHASGAKDLLNSADLALYEVKKGGRNGFYVFNPEMKALQAKRKKLELELKAAIYDDTLDLHYQPIVNSSSGRVRGYEALIRWMHPSRGLLPPGEFLPVAEEAGLMTALGAWAIRRACEQAVFFPEDCQISVNVSPSQLRSLSIVDAVKGSLDATGLAPGRLVLEVTETAILGGESNAARVIEDLLLLGVGLALDDFGTGYSSLSHLQRFAFTEVKIDRSFVAGIGTMPVNLAIVRGVIGIAREIGIDVIAEGIETEAQAEALRREGCEYLQGYLFSRPMPFADVVTDLAVQELRRGIVKERARGSHAA
ncbi:putative bifunctional diguanylate cyclase/phosphodiesterase [Aestuariivirga sp.]|uniref:putative bifunctional diguanylate cyclase/phosphodiesterase n=1 Tax=Aestuariivirga sp. TaxID=2650926 RepID=UPI003593180A